MAKLNVPKLSEVLVASSSFPSVQGYYPGSGPDGSGETDAPDGPFKPISPMTFAVDHRQIPEYVIEAITRGLSDANGNDPAALERALVKELEAMGVDPADVGLGGETASKTAETTQAQAPSSGKRSAESTAKPSAGEAPSTAASKDTTPSA